MVKLIKNLFQNKTQTVEISPDTSSEDDKNPLHFLLRIRNIVGFWILGVTNLYGYQILLSAAHDILGKEFLDPNTSKGNETMAVHFINNSSDLQNDSAQFDCNELSTGVVLLTEIIPQVTFKLILPFCYIPPVIGITVVVTFLFSTFLLIGFQLAPWTTFLSIGFVAIPTAVGEVFFLQYSRVYFGKKEMLAWAAGTGGGAILSALIYASMTTAGISVRVTLHCMIVVPILMLITYLFIIDNPKKEIKQSAELILTQQKSKCTLLNVKPNPSLNLVVPVSKQQKKAFIKKIKQIKELMVYTLPMSLVFFAEYFINLGLYELIYFPGIWLSHNEQYRWFMMDYQMSVFLSRTIGSFVKIPNSWILPLLQVLNIAIFMLEVFFNFIPSIWIMFVLIFYEGLLGGSSYVTIFRNMTDKVDENEQKFAISVVAVGDTIGICLAGLTALPVHDYICNLLIK